MWPFPLPSPYGRRYASGSDLRPGARASEERSQNRAVWEPGGLDHRFFLCLASSVSISASISSKMGDGALGFWAAVREVRPETREQRCWVHRLVNVLDKLPSGCSPRPS